jgi:DNA-binding response OmpR family regulator
MAKTILFIEDEVALQQTLGELLKEEGFNLLQAYDGEEGLKMTKENKVDLILLDIILPKKRGLDILEEIKKDSKTTNVPVIVFTNLEDTKDISRAMELGIAAYIVKANYTLDDTVKKIKETLSK